MSISNAIERLLSFALARGLLREEDLPFARNQVLCAIGMQAPVPCDPADDDPLPPTATPMLEALTDAAVQAGRVRDIPFFRDQFGAHLMNLLTPSPSALSHAFTALRAGQGPQAATDWFYALCRANDYIRVDQIARNISFIAPSPYGALEVTINLSKPEKDPREIALLKDAPSSDYPRCMLCVENEGYVGRPGYPSHETLRILPLSLCGEHWGLQFSPYCYYDEHCIALNRRHVPMSISRRTFSLLFDFVQQFPHYFIGSNADLPIVGGSILSHDHFQGGRHVFAMDRAPAYAAFAHADFPSVRVEVVRWPMTCLRLTGGDTQQLTELATAILAAWRVWDDPAHDILHTTGGKAHNTITPILRMGDDGRYILQLVLRNNRTSDMHPLGIFHPHADLHHIKRENIGLIEVMGLFVLPGRLANELAGLAAFLTGARALTPPPQDDPLAQHFPWIQALVQQHGAQNTLDNAHAILRTALSEKCVRVLEDSGVYKQTDEGNAAFARFLAAAGLSPTQPVMES